MQHYRIAHENEYTCSCGEQFYSIGKIWDHMKSLNPTIIIGDGVTKCPSCNGASYLAKLEGCKNLDHLKKIEPFHLQWDDLIGRDVDHTWQNWEDAIGSTELAKPPYICKCKEEFDTHAELMKHTAELNPIVETRSMGSAGVAIEYGAHKETLEKLERALDFLEGAISAELVEANWENAVKTFLKEVGRHHNEPFEETGFGD